MKQVGFHTQAVNRVNDDATADANLQHAALIALDWGTTSLRAYLTASHATAFVNGLRIARAGAKK